MDIWTRCFIWEQIPVDRLLYLDTDIVVHGSLARFYYDDLGSNLIKACPDYGCYGTGFVNIMGSNSLVRLHDEHGYKNEFGQYFNTGVILFDLAKMRSEGITVQSFIDFYHNLRSPLRMHDQDFLNLFFEGRIKLANPYRYNCLIPPLDYMIRSFFNDFSQVDMSEAPYPANADEQSQPETRGVTYDPHQIIVYHYNSHVKPNATSYHYRFAKFYWHYQLMDPSDSSTHTWTRLWQAIWGPIRRLIPECPLAFVRRKPGYYLKTNKQ